MSNKDKENEENGYKLNKNKERNVLITDDYQNLRQ